MSNFPIQFTDKVNSAELLAFLQQFGEETYVDAELINKFRDALNELHARTADTRIVENTGLDIVGTDVIINELWKWLILSISYTNNSTITLPITLSSAGNQKICFLCANQSNGFELVYGPESETNPVAPTIASNLLYITFFIVTDSEIGAPVDPIIGDIYKKKLESLGYGDPYLTGTNAVIQLRPEGNSRYAFSNAGLVSIDGFGLDLISGNPDAEAPYPGKDLFIENTGTTPFSLLHQGAGDADSKFFFLDETDLVVPAGGKVWLKYGVSDCEVIFKSWTDNIIEGYFNGTSFYTDSGFTNLITATTGRIYIDLATNSQYRWSGSAYVQIGGLGKKTDKITYTHTSANNINVLNTWFRFYNSQGWNNNVINANSETGSTPNLIFTNGSSKPILPNSKLVKCVLSFTWASSATPSSFEVYVGTSEFTEGVVSSSIGINQQTLILETVNFTSSTSMNLIKNLTINPHSALPLNKLFFAVREKATTKQYSFQLDFYFEEQ